MNIIYDQYKGLDYMKESSSVDHSIRWCVNKMFDFKLNAIHLGEWIQLQGRRLCQK